MKYTIEDLRNGKCAVKNDGTLEELRKVLKMAFPDDILTAGKSNYYFADSMDYWCGNSETNLPVQSVKDFLWTPKVGEIVLVRDFYSEPWEEFAYMGTIPQSPSPFKVTSPSNAELVMNGGTAREISFRQMKQCTEEPSIEITVKVNGKEVSPSVISEETWGKLRSC